MRMMSIAALCLALLGCSEETHNEAARAPDHTSADTLETIVTALASDDWEGREAGTQGYDKSAVYVAERYQKIGLRPAGLDGTYFQPILFKDIQVVEGSAQVILRGEDEPILLQYLSDYYVILNASTQRVELTAPLVFANYGITAPAFGLDDYAGLDVAGKIAVVFSGLPDGLPPEEGAVLSSLESKAANAAAAGAKGLAFIYTQQGEKASSFPSLAERSRKGSKTWLSKDGTPSSPVSTLETVLRLSPDAGRKLFEGSAKSYSEIRAIAAAQKPQPGFALTTSLTVRYLLEETTSVSSNIIGVLPARSDAASDEAVMIVAHLDHLGRGTAVEEDEIYNGAVDNALGVASILEAARALSALPDARHRAVYVAALTAEESGLLGAHYLAENLPVPPAQLTAVLNIDMPVALYPFATVLASGEVHSNLGGVASRAAQRYGLRLEPDPMPQETIFVRSDHYAFVKQGIPSIYLNIGIEAQKGSSVDGLQHLNDFLDTHYHQPSDEVSLPIDWTAAARFADVHVEMLRELVNTQETITWAPDSFFNRPRAAE